MATYDTYSNGQSTISSAHTEPSGGPGAIFYTQDFDAAQLNLTTADKVQLFALADGIFVEEVIVRVLTLDAGGAGLNVGDGTQAAGYGAYATLSSAAILPVAAGSATTYLYTNTTNAKVKPKLITAANDKLIYIAPTSQSVTTLKVRVTIKCIQVA